MSMNSRPFTAIATAVFALVAIGHLLRTVFGLELVVGHFAVPLSVSVVATIIAGCLSFMVWRESRG